MEFSKKFTFESFEYISMLVESHQYLGFTSQKTEKCAEINETKLEGNGDEPVPIKIIEEESFSDEIRFGEQLQDDLINSFCDKLQAVCPQKIEGLLAIQFLMITDLEDVRRHVTGENPAIQVFYDATRAHYVLTYYNVRYQHVELYDSLQPYRRDGIPMMLNNIRDLISHMYGHLHAEFIPVLFNREYEKQADNFSCGYRVVAALVDLARGREPAGYTYGRRAILKFMRRILNEPHPTWEMFESANFGIEKDYSGDYCVQCFMCNTTFVPSISPSESESSDSIMFGNSSGNKEQLQLEEWKRVREKEETEEEEEQFEEENLDHKEEGDFVDLAYEYCQQVYDSYKNGALKNTVQNVLGRFFRFKTNVDKECQKKE